MKPTLSTLVLIFVILMAVNSCDSGTYSDVNGICKQCGISCNTCSSSDGCSTCYDQMYLVTRGNQVVCDLCYKVNKGCDVCLTANKCQSCSAGYYLESDNTCSNCNTLFPNCLLCRTINETLCVSCQAPYQPINGQCVVNGTSTISQATTQNNGASSANSAASGNLTINQAYQAIMGASSTQPSGSSSSSSSVCDPSEINLNGNCYQTIAFCQTYSPTDGSCISCSSIFELANGYCLPSTLVSANSQGSAQAQAISQSQGLNPAIYGAPIGQSSSQGVYGSAISTDVTPSIKCTDRQYLSNGVCNDVGPQCLQFDSSSGTCYLCAANFQLYNGLCIQVGSTTASSSPSLTYYGSQVNSSQGTVTPNSNTSSGPAPANCSTVNPQNPSLCLICASGFAIVDAFPGVCYQIN